MVTEKLNLFTLVGLGLNFTGKLMNGNAEWKDLADDGWRCVILLADHYAETAAPALGERPNAQRAGRESAAGLL
jgi:hypothetical protein